MHTHSGRIRALVALVAALATAHVSTLAAQNTQNAVAQRTATLPERLSDTEFWKLVTDISEPGGYFRMADNFVSNERDIGAIAGLIRSNGPSGGIYMGVGPEQNLTYIAAVRPKMVFIVDIRRQAVMHHLLYKAIFELSNDRADFISLLFAKPRPAGLDSSKTIVQLWEAFLPVPTDTIVASAHLLRLRDHLTKTHGFALTPDELGMFDHVQNSFVFYGPQIRTSGGPGRLGAAATAPPGLADSAYVRALAAALATLASQSPRGMAGGVVDFIGLTSISDSTGQYNSFLANEESFRFLKDLHTRNLFVPSSGNFGGPKAIRAVGAYARERGAIVSAFYVSNVEQYLFGDGIAGAFYENVATLPIDEWSVFIRPGGFRSQVALCPIAPFLRAVRAGRIGINGAAVGCAS